VTSSVIAPWSSANLEGVARVVVLDSPIVAADYAEQISHGSPSPTTVWIDHNDLSRKASRSIAVLWPSRVAGSPVDDEATCKALNPYRLWLLGL
jgi:hypothetical protein